MIKLLGKLPRKLYLAISGGVDSMVAYDFLSRNHEVVPVFFNHGTETSKKAEQFLLNSRLNNKFQLIVGQINNPNKPKDKSWEEYWREERYRFFREIIMNNSISGLDDGGKRQFPDWYPYFLTAHHLDDCVETYLFSAMHGNPKLIQYKNGLYYRPFLLNKKSELVSWAERHNVPYIQDETNSDLSHPRNRIRHNILPEILKVNPGIYKTVYKMILEKEYNKGDKYDKEILSKELKKQSFYDIDSANLI